MGSDDEKGTCFLHLAPYTGMGQLPEILDSVFLLKQLGCVVLFAPLIAFSIDLY